VIEAALSANRAYADVLINSAGMGLAGPFHEQAPEAIMQLGDLNVRALTALTQHFLAGVLVRGRGGILNLASLGSYTPGPNQGVYYASKAYVLSLSESIEAETAGLGVRITALAPGPVNTGFHARMGSEQAFYRYMVSPASPESTARAGYWAFALGLRVYVPGLLNPLLALLMRISPHRILIPIVRALLKPRGG
jgi:short-subunit dehydrogenase